MSTTFTPSGCRITTDIEPPNAVTRRVDQYGAVVETDVAPLDNIFPGQVKGYHDTLVAQYNRRGFMVDDRSLDPFWRRACMREAAAALGDLLHQHTLPADIAARIREIIAVLEKRGQV